ncbi:MAG: alpha/beta fold hydrolase [Lachnospiraceae bacterium]|nr:alpha/beta fold hydrolase [Lachnospiraceae bacterium]
MKFEEEKVIIQGEVSIGATISYSNKNSLSPAVVLIMGTGKTDRDGNRKGFITDFYKNLANLFTTHGFVCIRYDKRGIGETDGDYDTAGLEDLTKDACAVVRYIKNVSYVDKEKVILCGHSEGTMIGALLSRQESVAGVLLLGGAGMNMRDALLYQNHLLEIEANQKKGLMGSILRSQTKNGKADKTVEALFQKTETVKKDRFFFRGAMMNAKWLREHDSYTAFDYASMINKLNKPVLAVTGTADLSADYKRLDIFKDIPQVEIYAPERVNHILRQVDDENSMLTVEKQYKRLAAQPIDEKTKKMIIEWMMKI